MAEFTPPLDPPNPFLEISRGNIPGQVTVNKFGRNPDVDTATDPEDVWDAGAIWVAPTQARTHDIASSDANDDGDPVGTGARTVRIYGLTDWDTAEATEDITLNGTTNVATSNSYVIIHRMIVLTVGSGGVNAGTISATAQTDSTVTAQIAIGKGQTLMAIYGLPSTQKFYVTQWYMDWNRSGGATNSADMELFVKENADQSDAMFVVKHHLGLYSAGNSHVSHPFNPPLEVTGPAIIKVQVENVSANDTDISAGFDGVLVNNQMTHTSISHYAVLAQSRPGNTTATSAYSPVASITTEINTIVVCNTSGASAKFRIFLDNDGTTYDETTALFWDIQVAADTTVEIDAQWWMNKSSGNLAVRTDTASAFTFSVFGAEHQS